MVGAGEKYLYGVRPFFRMDRCKLEKCCWGTEEASNIPPVRGDIRESFEGLFVMRSFARYVQQRLARLAPSATQAYLFQASIFRNDRF